MSDQFPAGPASPRLIGMARRCWQAFLPALSPGCCARVVASWRAVLVAAATLGTNEPSKGINGGADIWVRIEPDATWGADASPVPCQQRAAEQVGPDGEAVEAPLVALGTDASQRRGVLERAGVESGRPSRAFGDVGVIP